MDIMCKIANAQCTENNFIIIMNLWNIRHRNRSESGRGIANPNETVGGWQINTAWGLTPSYDTFNRINEIMVRKRKKHLI